MKVLTLALTAAAVLTALPAAASEDLVKANKCVMCHDMTAKKVGPTWKEIAAKNKGQKDAEATLAAAIVKGSKGKYGKAMPPQPKAAGDADAMAKWIMTL